MSNPLVVNLIVIKDNTANLDLEIKGDKTNKIDKAGKANN